MANVLAFLFAFFWVVGIAEEPHAEETPPPKPQATSDTLYNDCETAFFSDMGWKTEPEQWPAVLSCKSYVQQVMARNRLQPLTWKLKRNTPPVPILCLPIEGVSVTKALSIYISQMKIEPRYFNLQPHKSVVYTLAIHYPCFNKHGF